MTCSVKAVAAQKIAPGQDELDLGLDDASGHDEVFRQLAPTRIIEPTSKQGSPQVLAEAGIEAASYPTVVGQLPAFAATTFRDRLTAALAGRAGLGPASLARHPCPTTSSEPSGPSRPADAPTNDAGKRHHPGQER